MCAWLTRSQQKARNGGGKGDNATPVMVTGRNTPVSCYTMSECSCLEWVCAKNVGFNFVQSELDASVKWCNYDENLQEKHTHPCLMFRAVFLLHKLLQKLYGIEMHPMNLNNSTEYLPTQGSSIFHSTFWQFLATSSEITFVLSVHSAEHESYSQQWCKSWL